MLKIYFDDGAILIIPKSEIQGFQLLNNLVITFVYKENDKLSNVFKPPYFEVEGSVVTANMKYIKKITWKQDQ